MCKRWMISGVRVIPVWLTVCLIVACIHLSFVTSSAFMLRLVGWIFASLVVFVVCAAALGSRKRRRAAAAKSRLEQSSEETSQTVKPAPENRIAPEKISRCRRARSARTLPCRTPTSTSQSSRFNLPRFS
jgi:Mg2+/citrate symporter